MFSVVIPLYNKELSINDTINSVLNQTYLNFEIVVVNDGSTDQSAEIVNQINDSRIRLIHQENQGVSAARNKGVEEAKYEWIAFLDGDDLWEANHLEEFVKMIKLFPEDKVFCTSHTKSKLKEDYERTMIDGYEVIEDYFDVVMKHVDFFWTGAVCIHKTVFGKAGGFPAGISRGEDLYLWAQIGRKYRIIRSEVNTVYYKIDSENKLTSSISVYKESIISKINLKKMKNGERKYFKGFIFRRLKRNIKRVYIVENIRILLKHNTQLFL